MKYLQQLLVAEAVFLKLPSLQLVLQTPISQLHHQAQCVSRHRSSRLPGIALNHLNYVIVSRQPSQYQKFLLNLFERTSRLRLHHLHSVLTTHKRLYVNHILLVLFTNHALSTEFVHHTVSPLPQYRVLLLEIIIKLEYIRVILVCHPLFIII